MKTCVYLVGAGPGDKDLITVRGLELIKNAEVIVYDHLANNRLLDSASDTCETIYVGKEAGRHTMGQEDINALLIDLAKKYDIVVRLKGGDPYVFGRGSEEGEALIVAGVDIEVVPGITSAIGGLAYAGIPITSRGVATSFHVITGHVSQESKGIDYKNSAKLSGTLVFLMGVSNLSNIVKGLIDGGKKRTTPVAIIYKATTPNQKVVVGTLETIDQLAKEAQIKPPSLIVVGDVVNHRTMLSFFEKRLLFNQHILVTRSRSNSSKLSKQLEDLGARVTELPTIRTEAINVAQLEEVITQVHKYNKIIFTSGVTVQLFFDKMKALRLDARHLSNQEIVVIGTETHKILNRYGVYADHIPDTFNKEGITALLKNCAKKGESLLIPRSAKADTTWIETLKTNYQVTEVQCYDTILIKAHKDSHRVDEDYDYITFTSSSTVEGLFNQWGDKAVERIGKAKIVAIGPMTRKKLEGYGIKVDLQPKRYTLQDMVKCISVDIITNQDKDI